MLEHMDLKPEELLAANIYIDEEDEPENVKDYDKEFDEAGFRRVLAAALDSGRDDMDFFDATKLAKERSR